tara:strand:+ start:156 stop:386 length:231 start_codon:yes stop_codon:yes gene_type:complete
MKINEIIGEWIAMPHTAKAMGLRKANSHWMPINVGNNKGNEDAAGVGIITKQNTTHDVKPGDEYKNVKKLHLGRKK